LTSTPSPVAGGRRKQGFPSQFKSWTGRYRPGREKHHYLNPVPIRLIHDRWIDKYTELRVSALAELKFELEETG